MTLKTTLKQSIDHQAGVISIGQFNHPWGRDFDPMVEIERQVDKHMVAIIDTKNKMIRDGLIALGWTPPPQQASQEPVTHEIRKRVRAHDPVSSIIAAEASCAFAGKHKDRIMAVFLDRDYQTAAQIAVRTGLQIVQVDRRLPELAREGRLEVWMADGQEMVRDGYRVWRLPAAKQKL